ncbi:class I SAM-dependent methyltransferase [Conchiformibius steedae]|uniref:Ribosomal RNA small subunit methyltransferase J n=1 Tax=Conchiformibius steedae TaxID=153493 RepID=A0A3P2ABF7_9NEIS|nr:class I SAM-dependent methyltransferase [Conchiformibius steedae]RRD90953.1 16S rRNA methyltransferase [Conchiformibius steedae]
MNKLFLYSKCEESLPDYAQIPDCHITDTLPENGLYLHHDSDGISLCQAGQKGRVRVDFVGGAAHYRRTKGGGELLSKAVNRRACASVWDATGGLGRDAFVLAGLGLRVRVFERHAAVYCLLADGLARAAQCAETAEIVQNISLHHGDAAVLLPEYAAQYGKPDVVYLDPMYPERQKSAAVKKEMAYFHALVGQAAAQDDADLLAAARACAGKRVVVKRPRLGEYLCGATPAYQYTGKSTRFDAYLPTP